MLLDLLGISQNVGALLRVDTRNAIEKVGLEAKGDRSSRRVDDCVAGFWDVHVENGFSCDSSYVGSCANRRDQPKEKRVSHWILCQDGGSKGTHQTVATPYCWLVRTVMPVRNASRPSLLSRGIRTLMAVEHRGCMPCVSKALLLAGDVHATVNSED